MAPASIDNRLAQSSAGDHHRPPCVPIMLDDGGDSVKGESESTHKSRRDAHLCIEVPVPENASLAKSQMTQKEFHKYP